MRFDHNELCRAITGHQQLLHNQDCYCRDEARAWRQMLKCFCKNAEAEIVGMTFPLMPLSEKNSVNAIPLLYTSEKCTDCTNNLTKGSKILLRSEILLWMFYWQHVLDQKVKRYIISSRSIIPHRSLDCTKPSETLEIPHPPLREGLSMFLVIPLLFPMVVRSRGGTCKSFFTDSFLYKSCIC